MAEGKDVDVEKVGDLLDQAREKGGIAQREPVALFGLIAFGIAVVVVLVAAAVGSSAVGTVIAGVVMLAQLFFVRKKVFSPTTAYKLAQASRSIE